MLIHASEDTEEISLETRKVSECVTGRGKLFMTKACHSPLLNGKALLLCTEFSLKITSQKYATSSHVLFDAHASIIYMTDANASYLGSTPGG